MYFALTNLDGEVVEHANPTADSDLHPNEFVRTVSRYAQRVKAQFEDRELIGLGIATPGYVDPASGDVLSIGRAPNWPNFPLRSRLEAELGLPVAVENDVDCMALVEINGGESGIEDSLYVGLIEGVKASMYLNGQLYKGPFGNAGLIGHTTVLPDGLRCSCGKKGCLETIASVHAVNERFDQRIAAMKDAGEELKRIGLIEDRTAKFQAILQCASSGDETCSEIVGDMIDALAQAIANLVYLLQVSTLIIGGALSGMHPDLQNHLENEVRRRLSPLLSNHLVIRQAQITSPYAAAIGASQRLFERLVSSSSFDSIDFSRREVEYAIAGRRL
jgi:glucokinase